MWVPIFTWYRYKLYMFEVCWAWHIILGRNSISSMVKEVVIVIVCCLYVGVCVQARDLTLEPDTSGSDVVRAAVAKVLTASRNQTRIFGSRLNYWLLCRIMYAETEDGIAENTALQITQAQAHSKNWRKGPGIHCLRMRLISRHSGNSR